LVPPLERTTRIVPLPLQKGEANSLGRLRQRLARLERGASRPGPRLVQAGSAVHELRKLDETIRRLESEIAQEESCMRPEELDRAREESVELDRRLRGLSLDGKIELLERELVRTGGGDLT
jgi:hypothetical protein